MLKRSWVGFCALMLGVCLAAGPSLAGAPVDLKKIDVGIDDGAKVGEIRGGALCLTSPWLWRVDYAPKFEDRLLEQRFQKTMARLGYAPETNSKDLFSPDAEKSIYLLAGRVDSVDLRVCYPSAGYGDLIKSKGKAAVKVTWQIYSQEDHKVVATIATQGSFDRAHSISDGSYAILLKAFEGAIGQLVGSPQFTAVYGPAPKQAALPEPDPILPPGQTDPAKALSAAPAAK